MAKRTPHDVRPQFWAGLGVSLTMLVVNSVVHWVQGNETRLRGLEWRVERLELHAPAVGKPGKP